MRWKKRTFLEAVVGFSPRFVAVLVAIGVVASVFQSSAIVFTNDLLISSSDTNYDGLDIVVTNCTVTIDGAHAFASLRILSGGVVTHSVSTGHTGLNLTTTGDVWVDGGGAINADGKGYIFSEGLGNGNAIQLDSRLTGSGAGHGGFGGTSSATGIGGASYGLAQQPSHKGSTGGLGGGSGGGALRLIVGGAFILNGSLSANGDSGTNNRSGGGSGGSIWLTAQSVSGAGVISANGGSGEPVHGNGGGGGRVAIECETNTFVRTIVAHGGRGARAGGAGTVYMAVAGENALLSADNNGHAGANTPVQITNACDLAVSGGAAVIFSSALTVGHLSVVSNGWLTVPAFQLPGASLNLTATGNVTIASQSGILADARGYPGGQGTGRGYASTFLGAVYGSGGGYGGQGGMAPPNSVLGPVGGNSYGSIYTPSDPGSGGGSGFTGDVSPFGAPGGGAIRLTVGGTLLLDGIISANGSAAAPQGGGGGSGGSIWLTAGTMAGSGTISANGGSANPLLGGGGGGGRIALYYTTNLFTGTVSARGGDGANAGGAGTIYTQLSGASGHLLVDNGGRIGTTRLMMSGMQNLTIGGGAVAQLLGSPPLGTLLIKSNSFAIPAYSLQGDLYLTVTRDATIEPGAGIIADRTGYPAGQGPGSGGYVPGSSTNYGGGGGHGGYGGAALHPNARGGNAYGGFDSPNTPGSGGGGFVTPTGGAGGGVIQLNVTGTLRLDGEISADGGAGFSLGGGGGAGGSVSVRAGTVTGTGIVSANGGDASGPNGGGGGGGRIAIYFSTNAFSGGVTAYGGSGGNVGGAGTVYVKPLELRGQLLVDNGGRNGTNTFILPGMYDLTVGGGGTIGAGLFVTGDLLVKSNGWMASTSPFGSELRITGNARIERGGGIFAAAVTASGFGRGYQSSFGPNGGGGHGGYGGANPSGFGGAYGSIQNPQNVGGAGGSASGTSFPPFGGAGGGALRITVSGSCSIDGEISADGRAGDANRGGGAGGSVWLTAGTLTGSGIISANGGAGNGTAGGGGGGRIAIYYDTNLFTGAISAYGGAGAIGGGAGTFYTRRINEPVERLLVDNGGRFGTNTPLQNLSAAFELAVRGGAAANVSSSFLSLSNLLVGSGSSLIGVAMNLDVAILGDAVIEGGGGISVDGKGYVQMSGPGAGGFALGAGSGAGYGGVGGASAGAPGGSAYGSAEWPSHAGSGGGGGFSSSSPGNSQGGGALRLTVGRALTVEGRLGADGNAGLQDNSGGGSGGSIWVTAGAISGDGIISANGGAGEPILGGGGGGGRIALYSPTNSFTGLITVLGGEGAERGENGTIYASTNLPAFGVVSQQPAGTVTNPVYDVELIFSSAFNPSSASASDVTVTTPNGVVATGDVRLFVLSPSMLRIIFPEHTAVGDYTITIGPQIEDVFGRPMSQSYTGTFSILLPEIRGVVRGTNGQAMAGVTLYATGGLPLAFTDGNGEYRLGVTNGWSGGVVPLLDGFMFVPASRAYTNVNASLVSQDYLIVNTIAPAVATQLQGTNLFLNWQGIPGVAYQPLWSTNLVNWFPWGSLLSGSNGVMKLWMPVDDDPMKFFRIRSEN